ncbi:MAG: hypothetical protein R2751_20180, partial [Bacteroidales bacterium]
MRTGKHTFHQRPAGSLFFLLWLGCLVSVPARGQSAESPDTLQASRATLDFKGQALAYTHINPSNALPWWNGVRYIPQVNARVPLKGTGAFDLEASGNLYGNAGWQPFDTAHAAGDVKPYRLWLRYATHQLEIRAGLQKINFGSASLLRPLMWFDQIDPRDPLKLTDGVWGVLGRYYFLNNANLWLWALYGNENRKGWEAFPSVSRKSEFGGRLQLPVPAGEAAFSYHHRQADLTSLGAGEPALVLAGSAENRFGFDVKVDAVVGLWLEGSWSNFREELGAMTNQEIINLGMDYTFGVGNGLTIVFEQLMAASDERAFAFENTVHFSLLNMSYPLGLFDNLSAIVYFDWTGKRMYNFMTWQRQFNRLALYVMGYINPKEYDIPT